MNDLLLFALKEFGVSEITGPEHSKRIMQWAKDLGWDWYKEDEVPWCSLFMNWVAFMTGYIYSNKANARSWLEIGELVSEPQLGDIVVFKRGDSSWQGHVGIYINTMKTKINCLAGNQSNKVNISSYYSEEDVLGYIRLPKIAG